MSTVGLLEARHEWKLNDEYEGPYQESFQKLRWEVPNLIRQTSIDMSVKLGLPYDEGWRFPLLVQFVDGQTVFSENMLAFVTLYATEEGIAQTMSINLSAYETHQFDFPQVLAHELIHAMMNDFLGAEASSIFPRWLHEGLAVYGSGEGEARLEQAAHKYSGFAESRILNGLERHRTAVDYVEDYLAIKYIVDEHGPNALPFFLREIANRGGNVKEAYEYATGESWSDFLTNEREFSKEQIRDVRPPKAGR